jgi:hypothetical protein
MINIGKTETQHVSGTMFKLQTVFGLPDLILKASGYGVSNEGNDHKVLDSSSELSFKDNISGGLSGKSLSLAN